MRTQAFGTLALGAALLLAACSSTTYEKSTPATAQPAAAAAGPRGSQGTTPPAEASSTPQQGEMDPEAVKALSAMGAYLRSLEAFSVKAFTAKDETLENDQNVQLTATVDLWVRRPDRMRADIVSERKTRQFFYDGKTFTLYGPKSGYYATFAAPPTLRALVQVARDQYDLELPLADLFAWGSEDGRDDEVSSAIRVGPSDVGGVATVQYAFRLTGVDYQVWVESGDRPLPRKFVITTTDEPSHPQYSVVMSWNLTPKLEDASFQFVAPKGAQRIVFEGQTGSKSP